MHRTHWTFRLLLLLAVAVLAWACKDDKGDEGKKKEKTPQEMCQQMFDSRKKIGMFKDVADKHKKAYLEACVKQPKEYLVCDSTDFMEMAQTMSDEEMKKCRQLLEKHQDYLNTILLTGKPPEAKK